MARTSAPRAGRLVDCIYTTWHRGGPNVMQTELLFLEIVVIEEHEGAEKP